jgi:hypothetical protein
MNTYAAISETIQAAYVQSGGQGDCGAYVIRGKGYEKQVRQQKDRDRRDNLCLEKGGHAVSAIETDGKGQSDRTSGIAAAIRD